MDYKELVDEILSRVAAKMADLEKKDQAANKKRILILTQMHGAKCHEFLENTKLLAYCQTDCALLKDYQCDPADYDAVVLYNLTNQTLHGLANGSDETPFISLASKAILMGKKVYIPKEEIELYQYEKTAPDTYYAMMHQKLKLLQDSGIILCDNNELEQLLTADCRNSECLCKKQPKETERVFIKIEKKIITEKDLILLTENRTTCIGIRSNAILTDLAKEYLKTRNIVIEREKSSGRKQG